MWYVYLPGVEMSETRGAAATHDDVPHANSEKDPLSRTKSGFEKSGPCVSCCIKFFKALMVTINFIFLVRVDFGSAVSALDLLTPPGCVAS